MLSNEAGVHISHWDAGLFSAASARQGAASAFAARARLRLQLTLFPEGLGLFEQEDSVAHFLLFRFAGFAGA